ncbi:MAG: hypothetical protein IM565_09620 [Pseudanabaena sp. M109S1SP2A07QC]|jgi:hypothetical protein|nr:hypothetical protein [Pseudanabaena sp. M109S1SP2A07QC]
MPLCALRCGAIASIKIISETLRDRTACTVRTRSNNVLVETSNIGDRQNFLLEQPAKTIRRSLYTRISTDTIH